MKNYKEAFGVVIYVVGYIILTLLYCTPRILAECTMCDPSKLPIDFNFPLELYSAGLLIICGFYSGIDFGIPTKFKLKTKAEKTVKANNILLVSILLTLVLAESLFFCIRFGYDYRVLIGDDKYVLNSIQLPLKEISIALIMTWCFYVTGSEITNGD